MGGRLNEIGGGTDFRMIFESLQSAFTHGCVPLPWAWGELTGEEPADTMLLPRWTGKRLGITGYSAGWAAEAWAWCMRPRIQNLAGVWR